jgi:hypothetical protein
MRQPQLMVPNHGTSIASVDLKWGVPSGNEYLHHVSIMWSASRGSRAEAFRQSVRRLLGGTRSILDLSL